ncbi:MAG: TetR family transcriptional regulator [Cyanobacteria bacterium J06632_22]
MSNLSTRQRLTQAALQLFLTQGVSQTTTRQIADQAGVNEATLFRNFGNKYGLLLAMLQDVPMAVQTPPQLNAAQPAVALKGYADVCLQALEQFPRFVQSVIGEADHYSEEQVQLLRARLVDLRHEMASHLDHLLGESARLSSEDVASCLGALLVGYVVIEATSGYSLWPERQDFLEVLARAFVTVDETAVAAQHAETQPPSTQAGAVQDLPAVWVHQVIKQAKGLSLQDQALALVLFGAGLRPEEVPMLLRSHHISDKTQHLLQVVVPGRPRQVSVNQWILGKRYGSYTSNAVTKWLKARKDGAAHLFITESGEPLSVEAVQARWDQWWQGIDVGATVPDPIQARQTWCVEMLMRGMSLENLSILAGCEVAELRPYARRGQEKSAIAAATQLDKKIS